MSYPQCARPIAADDLTVTLAAREELGREHDSAVIGEFLDRVGTSIDARVDARIAARDEGWRPPGRRAARSGVLPIASVVMGIPVTAIAMGTTHGGFTGLIAMIIGWGGLAAVNFVQSRPRS
ncbi:MAG: hypothetical protein ACRDRL_31025 [Sciscionella sp.]